MTVQRRSLVNFEIMQNLGIAESLCGKCLRIVPAKVVAADGKVYFHKFCPDHGRDEQLVHTDVNFYLQAQRSVKPALTPLTFSGTHTVPCPQGCGFCSRHEQHLCLPIVEITSRCDLTCPACIANAGHNWDLSVDEFDHILNGLIRAEKQIDVINLSGGEPLLHPRLLDLVDLALAHLEIIRVSISTNGLRLLEDPALAGELKKRNVVIALQFDGYDDRTYEILRGRKLLKQKRAILDLLVSAGMSVSLTYTAAGGINTDPSDFSAVLELLFAYPAIISLMIQPLSFAGRGEQLKTHAERISIPDIIRSLDKAGNGRVRASDFAPLPCSHPLCFSLAYYLMVDGKESLSLNQLVEPSQLMDMLANKTIFGLDDREREQMKDVIYQLWSGPAGTAPCACTVMKTLRSILDQMNAAGFQPRQAFMLGQRHVKSVFIHAFQDAGCFDLSRVRRCCQGYPQPDGKIIPACVHNVLGRRTTHVSSPEARS